MKLTSARLARTGLLILVVALVGLVAWTLRRPKRIPDAPGTAGGGVRQNQAGGVRYSRFKRLAPGDDADKESFVLEADKMTGSQQDTIQLEGVRTRFAYLANGKIGFTTVTSKSCSYEPGAQKAVYEGQVVVTTEDGLELETESLTYLGNKQLARTEDPVAFRRNQFSGSSRGMIYKADQGVVDLLEDVVLHIAGENGGPTTDVESSTAKAVRDEGLLIFNGDVHAHRGPDTLTAGQLIVSFSSEDHTLVAADASEDVDLERAVGSPVPGMSSTGGKGAKSLKCTRLVVTFRPDKTPQDATAGGGAELILHPDPRGLQERRNLKARALLFGFDAKGRLEELKGQKEVDLTTAGVGKSSAIVPQRLTCNSFTAQVNPDTGETESAEFLKDVVLTRGVKRATAQRAQYTGKEGRLELRQGPELSDPETGSSLVADSVDLLTRSGDISARHGVQNVLKKPQTTDKPSLLGRTGEPAVMSCEFFEQVSKTRTTSCRVSAVLRSGRDEIRGPLINVSEDAHGRQRLTAPDGVESLLHPQQSEGKTAPEPVYVRARSMTYDEAKSEILYAGDVLIRQGDILSKSPQATATLMADGNTLQTVVAGEPVEMRQRERLAQGSRVTYTPGRETVVLVGEKASLRGPGEELQGRALTFHVGDNTIRVDGQEEVRTEAILRREGPKP